MNSLIFSIILVPIIEIYLFIKVGSQIGALNTIILIIITAAVGIFYARYEGLNTLRSGFNQIIKDQLPSYELISGAAIALAAILLIIPGFLTDFVGFILIFPYSRKLILKKFSVKFSKKETEKNNFIDGEYEDIEDDDDRKI